MRNKIKLDALDWEIMRILKADARIQYKDIAKKIGLSHPSVRYRVDKMLKNKIIDLTCIVNYPLLGLRDIDIGISLASGISPDTREKLATELAKDPLVSDVLLTSGDHQIIIRLLVKTTKELENFIDSKLRSLKEIRGIEITEITDFILRDQKILFSKEVPKIIKLSI